MFAVIGESVRLVNLPFTILLAGVVLYWVCVGLGLLHFGEGDHDVSLDAHGGDLHVEGHVDAHAHGGDAHTYAHGDGHSWLVSALKFLNVGEVPAMIIMSVLVLCTWITSMISNHYSNDNSIMRALIFLVPNLALSAIVELFDAKFSEALKTVGRQFNFVDLYNSREKLKEGILRHC
ncbi:MAG: hypothetical protein FJ403_13225 [Verrucomicrobia bacterium]|nr:hypothetical protein [Verrucomicrobiota bacterium]